MNWSNLPPFILEKILYQAALKEDNDEDDKPNTWLFFHLLKVD